MTEIARLRAPSTRDQHTTSRRPARISVIRPVVRERPVDRVAGCGGSAGSLGSSRLASGGSPPGSDLGSFRSPAWAGADISISEGDPVSGPSIDPALYRERDLVPIRRALVSVSDKSGLVELAAA